MLTTFQLMIVWVVVGVLILACIVLLVAEGRVMNKPEAQRSRGEQRFLSADRASARGYQAYSRSVAPWVAVGASVIGLVATVPLWERGRIGAALGLTVFLVVLGAGMVVLWATVLRKRGPGSAWRAAENARTREADASGRPRWFVSVRAGWWLGGVATALGLLALVGAMNGVVGLGESVAILAFGLLFLLLTFLQRRGEQRR